MTTKHKIGIVVVSLLVAFAAGRYSAHAPAVKTTSVAVVDTAIDTTRETHKKTVITKSPNGIETTTITENTDVLSEKRQDETLKTSTTVTPARVGTLNLSALAGVRTTDRFLPVYGLSVSKEIIGPVTAGLWGLTSGTVGVSVGINF